MLIDIRKFFQGKENDVDVELVLSYEGETFPSCSITQPVKAMFKATLKGTAMELQIKANAVVEGECARCLCQTQQELCLERVFCFKESELICDEPEIPITADFKLNVKELVYTELVLEVPSVLLCSKDCEGLCQLCGAKKGQGCTCIPICAVDDRLAILKNLLS